MRHQPALTERHDTLEDFTPAAGSVYVFATSPEERSAHSAEWEGRASNVRFVRLAGEEKGVATFAVGGGQAVSLRSASQLRAFWSQFGHCRLYIDITGFGHHVWAPLLRAAAAVSNDIAVVYVEPANYAQSATPTEGEIFDLSERITGIAPLPGFASFSVGDESDFHLVVFLGFEGTRFAYLLENVQPLADRVIPVVGVPGYRPEFPFYAYHGNRTALLTSQAWRYAQYVTANCPFRVFYLLEGLAAKVGTPLKVAPIGTKPHSVGAVLYAIAQEASVELVYDHPVRTDKRTVGASRALVYHVGHLLESRRTA